MVLVTGRYFPNNKTFLHFQIINKILLKLGFSVFDKIENCVGKALNGVFHFLLFPQCFELKSWNGLEKD